MRRIILILILSSITIFGYSEIVGLKFEPKEFDDKSYVLRFYSEEWDLLEVEELVSQTYNYSFHHKKSDYEIRYILFRQTEEIIDLAEYKTQVAIWAMMVINNITNDEEQSQNTSAFNDSDVKKEFNADYGLTNFSMETNTDYTEGYKYIMINFYAKKDLGIMCQTILFNDLEWTKTEDFLKQFHGFNFY